MGRYAAWLRREAIPAGGLGPGENDRIESRHLADSLCFAAAWRRPVPPTRLVDLGSGVGLPGIPLAILWPATRVWLVDRSRRRTDLARRAVRVLQLEGVEVVTAEAQATDVEAEMVVARAAAPPQQIAAWMRRLLVAEGVGVVGGSWIQPPLPAPGEEIREVPPEVLDRPVWIRIIAPA